jgi:hypothetical protein
VVELDSPEVASDVATRLVWTGSEGLIHERKPGAEVARCGVEYEGASRRWKYARPCQPCIDDALREYALTHDCQASGCLAKARGQPEHVIRS